MNNEIQLPDRQTFSVAEAAKYLAPTLGVALRTAKDRLYRAINDKSIAAHRIAGSPWRINRRELARIISGGQ
jgi:excisionase family DNA binding protein